MNFTFVCEFEGEAFRAGYYIAGTWDNPFSLVYAERCLNMDTGIKILHIGFISSCSSLLALFRSLCSPGHYCKIPIGKLPGDSSFLYL